MPEVTRFSTPQAFIQNFRDLSQASNEVESSTRRASDQKKFHRGSEDPRAAHAVYLDGSAGTHMRQIKDNIKHAIIKTRDDITNLKEMKDLLDKVNNKLLAGMNSATTSPEQYDALRTEVNSMKRQLLMLANGQNVYGSYIYAGLQSQNKPFQEQQDGTITYHGDNRKVKVEVAPGADVEIGVILGEKFVETYNLVDSISSSLGKFDQAIMRDGSSEPEFDEDGNLIEGSNVRSAKMSMSESLDEIKNHITHYLKLQGEIGDKQQELERYKRDNTTRMLSVTERLAEHQEVDMAQIIMDMTKSAQKMQLVMHSLAEKRKVESLSVLG